MSSADRDGDAPPATPAGGRGSPGAVSSFAVEEFTGTASLRLPLATSAPRDLNPDLELAYSSDGRNDVAGFGFSLPISSFSLYTGGGVPRYDGSDTFVFGGQPIVPLAEAPRQLTAGGQAYTVTRYAPRSAPVRERIERWVRAEDGDVVWRHVDPGGLESVYGLDPGARIADPAHPRRVFAWLLQAQYDQRGEAIAYEYLAEDGANLPDGPGEAGRDRSAQRYLGRVRYAPQTAVTPPPYGIGPVPDVQWHAEVVFDYGQYDAGPAGPHPYQPSGEWSARLDPFSRYEAGFEVRTHRLLRNVMLFHRFAELGEAPALVHLTRLTHAEDRVASRLTRYDSIGCATGEHAPLPPLELDYTPLEIGRGRFSPVEAEGPGRLVGVANPPVYNLADLAGEGAEDVLYADGRSVLRWPSEAGPGAGFERREAVPEFPVERAVAGGEAQLADMTGDGLADLLVRTPGRAGIYPRDEGAGFQRFQAFAGAPTELLGPAATFADLSDDGLPDLVALTEGRLRRYPGEGAAGFGAPVEVPAPAGAPASLESAPEGLTTFSDLLGGGAQDLVRISDGTVECWPSLGYGAFGERVVLGGGPSFGAEFDSRRVLLADLDGSGIQDLVYVTGSSAFVYVNQSGNSFAPPVEIPLPVTIGSPAQVAIADLRGTGTQMLLVTEATPELRHWACPLTGERRPYLLRALRNGLGAETEIEYTSSTRCWLEDERAGVPWASLLPFPVPLVAAVLQRDLVSDCAETSAYGYRHGYWCARDREYGFALVERRDTETIGGAEARLPPDPERLTRTWRLLGTFPDPELEAAIRAEWFAGDPEEKLLPGPAIDWEGSPPSDGETARQAYASLRGRAYRHEVYGVDGSAEEGTPYRVTQTAHETCLLAPAAGGPYAAFATHQRQSLDYVYERDASDPVVRHSLNLAIDPFGQVLRSAAVAYPRRPGTGVQPEQEEATVVCDSFAFADLDSEATFRVGIPVERESAQLTGLPLPPAGGIHSLAEMEALVPEALAGEGGLAASPLEASRHFYYAEDGVTPAPLGQSGPQALPRTAQRAAFEDAQIRALFAGAVEGAKLTALLERGEYACEGGRWWALGATHTYLPASSFHQLATTVEPCGAAIAHRYDATAVALLETAQSAAGVMSTNVVVELFDYAALAALTVRDVNDSVTEVALDSLGQVVLSSFRGTELGEPVGFEAIAGRKQAPPPSAAALIAEPSTYLKGAAEVSYYDLLSWSGRVTAGDLEPLGLDSAALLAALAGAGYVTPEGILLQAFRDLSGAASLALPEPFAAHAAAIHALLAALPSGQPAHWVLVSARNYPQREPGAPAIAVDYVDGFGRVVQRKQQASTATEEGWVTSGALRYDARGLVRARCESFFTDSWTFTPEDLGEQLGTATIDSYDPLGRLVRSDRPEGFFATVGIAAWSLTQADEVDTVLQSRYWREHSGGQGIGAHELQALQQAAALAETPVVYDLDPLGHAIARVDLLKGAAGQQAGEAERLVGRYGNDVLGRQVWSSDPRLTASGAGRNFETAYSLDGAVLRVVSADAGEQLRLRTASGRELFVRDGRGVEIENSYDSLGRPTAVTVREAGPEGPARIAEAYVYGDQLDEGEPIPPDPTGWNLVGQVYRLFDSAGMRQVDGYSLSHEPMVVDQRYLAEPAARPDWTPARAVPSSPLLTPEAWKSSRTYDPGGRLVAMTDPVGSAYTWTHDQLGFVAEIAMALPGGRPAPYLSSVEYNAQGQRTRVAFGNGMVTRFGYEPLSHRLVSAVTTQGEGGAALQEVEYVYDPVGNLTHLEDAAFAKLFGDAVPPLQRSFAYDSLYRTVTATGLEASGYEPALELEPGYAGLTVPLEGGTLPAGSVVSAARTHAYDAGGNLYWTERRAGESAWTTETVLSASSNRGVSTTLLGLSPAPAGTVPPERTLPAAQIDRFFDGDGNQTAVERMPSASWDYADRLEAATVEPIEGAGGAGSLLRAHDAVNALMRELQVTPAAGGERTLDTLYLDTLRVARVTDPAGRSASSWTVAVKDGEYQVAEALVAGGSASVAYSLTDPAGSVALRLGSDGELLSYEAYTPYGATAFAVLPEPAEAEDKLVRYDGHERDRLSGTYRFERRDLAPWLGRWLSPDPTGPVDGLNLFAFAGDNPTSSTDVGGRVTLKIDRNTTIEVTPEEILRAVEAAAMAIEEEAKQRLMASVGQARKMDLYEVSERGDLLRLAFQPALRGDPIAGSPVSSYALRFGNLDVTERPLRNEIGVHGTVIVKNQDRPGAGLFGYDELQAQDERAEARRLIRLFKVKEVPSGNNPNDSIVPVMAISETDRALVGGMLAFVELHNVKWGLHTFDQAFVHGNNPSFIGAKKRGGAKSLKSLEHIRREPNLILKPSRRMTRLQRRMGNESLETFVVGLHSRHSGKTSKFAGAKTAKDVTDRLTAVLKKRAGFVSEKRKQRRAALDALRKMTAKQ
ncbi:MAG: SpvB/TcaC N-terminal domain-containing protein [Solirubrobacterales bacterium]